MEIFTCPNNCCTLKIKPYVKTNEHVRTKFNRKKAGVCLYDSKTNRILLVQSRGNLWGIPKGTLEEGETPCECAIRETKEESGISVTVHDFQRATKIRNIAFYFYVERPQTAVEVQDSFKDNDANGIGWIDLKCLRQCIINGNIRLNKHSRIVIARFLGQIMPKSNFILVHRRRKYHLHF